MIEWRSTASRYVKRIDGGHEVILLLHHARMRLTASIGQNTRQIGSTASRSIEWVDNWRQKRKISVWICEMQKKHPRIVRCTVDERNGILLVIKKIMQKRIKGTALW